MKVSSGCSQKEEKNEEKDKINPKPANEDNDHIFK